jgi:hypothetical protein
MCPLRCKEHLKILWDNILSCNMRGEDENCEEKIS